ncbi:MAG: PAS domain-containing sensor histidine kinase [Bdellovibrio sp.]|nr:MAG: PAS domain-containing sensor histidine kinase [Bdellovibrio sp.]
MGDRFPLERTLVQAIRAGVYLVVILLAIIHHFYQRQFFSWEIYRNFYLVAAFGLILPVASLPLLNGFFNRRWLVAFSFGVDIFLISALLLTSRLNESIFLFFYLIEIILCGLVFQLQGALLLALTASVSSTGILLFGEEVKSMDFFFVLLLNNIALFSVAWISGFLAEQLELQGLNLADLRKLNQSIVETIPSGLLTVLHSGKIVQFNHGAELIFRDRLQVGGHLQSLFPQVGAFSASAAQVGAHGTSAEHNNFQIEAHPEKFEVRFNEGNEVRVLSLKILPQISHADPTFLVVVEDETQVRQLELAVRQSEKLAAVGQLAAGIAHEIRNPLAGISGSVELLSQHHRAEDDQRLKKIIMKEIDRLNTLISEFLDFAKPEQPPVERFDLAPLLHEVLEHAKHSPQLRQDVRQVKEWSPPLLIRGHRDKLKQAFLNVVINSYQAMAEIEHPTLEVRAWVEQDQLKVQIVDNGSGMDEKTQARIFEPFMTTKPRGTGLGLAITHKIIESHQGRIFVESDKGRGTKMNILFPVLAELSSRSPSSVPEKV